MILLHKLNLKDITLQYGPFLWYFHTQSFADTISVISTTSKTLKALSYEVKITVFSVYVICSAL